MDGLRATNKRKEEAEYSGATDGFLYATATLQACAWSADCTVLMFIMDVPQILSGAFMNVPF
jgi:hypothetical protein